MPTKISTVFRYGCVLASSLASVIGHTTELSVPTLEDISPPTITVGDRSRVQHLSDDASKLLLEDVPSQLRNTRGGLLVGSLRIKAELLSPPRAQLPLNRPSIGSTRDQAISRLAVEGKQLLISPVHVTPDPARSVRHVLLSIVEGGRGYGRFTVDETTHEIAGTLEIDGVAYRLVPHPSGSQLVYKVPGELNDRYYQFTRTLPKADRTRRLEKRHLQAELLSKTRPSFFATGINDFATVAQNGDFGTLDPDRATAEDIKAILNRLSPLTNATGVENFEITHISPRDPENLRSRTVRFRQVLNGIPVNRFQEIVVDQNHKIISLSTAVIDADAAPKQEPITEAQAATLAKDQLEAHLSSLGLSAEPGSLEIVAPLQLVYAPIGAEVRLVIEWHVRLDANGTPYEVTIDAASGAANVVSLTLHAAGEDFRTNVRWRNPSTGALELVWWEENDNGLSCEIELLCYDSKFYTSMQMSFLAGIYWEQVSASNPANLCCEGMGYAVAPPADFYLDTIVESDVSTPGAYRLSDRKIHFGIGSPYAASRDFNTHEVYHAYQHAANPNLVNAAVGFDSFAAAYVEGSADAMAAITAEKATHLDFGERWVWGDSSPAVPTGDQRDLRVGRTFSELNTLSGAHSKGQVFGNFFYRVRQATLSTVSVDRLMEYQLQVTKGLVDYDNDGYGLVDFQRAVEAALKPGEYSLQDAVNQAWQVMSGGSMPPGSAPLPPLVVDGFFSYCSSGWSVYTIYWSSSDGATNYRTYYKDQQGMWRYDNIWPSTGPFSAWVPYNTEWRVMACNSNGCSVPSFDTFITNDICQ